MILSARVAATFLNIDTNIKIETRLCVWSARRVT